MLRMTGFRIGEATTKDMTDPKGTRALRSPTVMGIVEQAQKGVTAPIRAPRIFPSTPLWESHRWSFSSEIYSLTTPIRVLMARKSSVSSAMIKPKK